jgi:tRNA-specific 2-thiouridylase
MAKIRYRQVSQDCTISEQDGEIKIKFNQPQRAITPGQSVVFYAQDVCLSEWRPIDKSFDD